MHSDLHICKSRYGASFNFFRETNSKLLEGKGWYVNILDGSFRYMGPYPSLKAALARADLIDPYCHWDDLADWHLMMEI